MAAPLVMIPGLLCDAALWRPVLERFSAEREVMVANVTRDDSLDAMARRLLDEAPPRFALAGLSMGGYVAMALLRLAPERVERVAFLDTSGRADTPEQTERRKALMELARQGRFKGVTPRLLPLLIHPARMDDPELTGTIMRMAERVGQAAFLRQQTAIFNRIDSRPHLRAVTCPAIVVAGRDDALTPPDITSELAACVGPNGAELTLLDQCGHLAPLERPEETNAVLARWLDS